MMGLKGLGKYDEHDDYYTRSFPSKKKNRMLTLRLLKKE